jgi:hypothetical protein
MAVDPGVCACASWILGCRPEWTSAGTSETGRVVGFRSTKQPEPGLCRGAAADGIDAALADCLYARRWCAPVTT